MESLDYWRLCEELKIGHAALLIAGCDPSGGEGNAEEWELHQRPDGYEAAKQAVSRALMKGGIKGDLVQERDHDMNGNPLGPLEGSIDLEKSSVEVESLRTWLRSRGFTNGFFFPGGEDRPDYLDPKHSRYAPKLAAAVNAWLAFEDPTGLRGTSPKQAMNKWLREHAAQYKLSDEEGKPNEKGIEECTKVANWKEKGGAPKTP